MIRNFLKSSWQVAQVDFKLWKSQAWLYFLGILVLAWIFQVLDIFFGLIFLLPVILTVHLARPFDEFRGLWMQNYLKPIPRFCYFLSKFGLALILSIAAILVHTFGLHHQNFNLNQFNPEYAIIFSLLLLVCTYLGCTLGFFAKNINLLGLSLFLVLLLNLTFIIGINYFYPFNPYNLITDAWYLIWQQPTAFVQEIGLGNYARLAWQNILTWSILAGFLTKSSLHLKTI